MDLLTASPVLCFAFFAVISARGVVAEPAGLTLLALGDWGGKSDGQPTTKAQISTAAGMSSVAEKLNARGILLLGDNFYVAGVQSCTSRRFQETFEEVYSDDHFKGLPFYVIAGNHDHDGNASAQVDYRDESGRWHFPSLYYNLNFTFKASGKARRAQFVMVDTVSLAGLSSDACLGCDLPGPKHLGSAEDQWSWIEDQLKSSTADFLFVAGHYPIYSAGQDGSTKLLMQRLLPLLKKYGAHYISGHDHMVEHIISDDVNMFVAGMGRECCYEPSHMKTVPDGAMHYMLSGEGGRGEVVGPKPAADVEGGFATLQFDDAVTVSFYDQDGNKLYAAAPLMPRSAEIVV